MAMLAVPVAAVKPSGACGAEASGWHVVTIQEWLEATEEVLGELPEAEQDEIVDGLIASMRRATRMGRYA